MKDWYNDCDYTRKDPSFTHWCSLRSVVMGMLGRNQDGQADHPWTPARPPFPFSKVDSSAADPTCNGPGSFQQIMSSRLTAKPR